MSQKLKNRFEQPKPTQLDQRTAFTNEQKANLFATAMGRQSANHLLSDDATEDEVRRANQDLLQQEEYIKPASQQEINHIISRLKNERAPGPNNIKRLNLQMMPNTCKENLLNIINGCLKIGYFRNQWKVSTVVMIPKSGKALKQPENYRPRSLLPLPGKILERVILIRLQNQLDEFGLLPNEQYAFRKTLSTTQPLFRITTYVQESSKRREITLAVFLDVSKAFNKV